MNVAYHYLSLYSTFNGLMALPNIVALIALSGVTAKLTKDYVDRRKAL
ncbi:MAG: alanine:cation symporter family protein [Treponemataceae bacterium]|nr:alanine:cation symporter family protein [Treponemataceae bacterium]